MKKTIIFLTIFLIGISTMQSFAQWQLSLTSSSSWSMARKDTNVLAGISNGIYFSDNYGTSWTLKNCPATYVRSIVVKDSIIFITADYDGIYKSIDNGVTWLSIDSGITNPAQAWSLIQNDSLLILGTSGSFSGDTAAIYISSDDGNSWTKVFSLGMFDVFYSFAVSGNEVFVGVLPSGLFYSNDKGVTWTLKNTSISAKHIALADTNLLCGVSGAAGGIYLSTDKGTTWLNVMASQYGNCFATFNNITFAGASNGFHYSLDNGYTWINDNNGLPPLTQVISACVADSFIFIGTTGAEIYKRDISDIATGLNELNTLNSDLAVFPNPSSGTFTISSTSIIKNGTVEIYNSLGKKIFNESIQLMSTKEVTLKNISQGIYIVKVLGVEKSFCKKVIIE